MTRAGYASCVCLVLRLFKPRNWLIKLKICDVRRLLQTVATNTTYLHQSKPKIQSFDLRTKASSACGLWPVYPRFWCLKRCASLR